MRIKYLTIKSIVWLYIGQIISYINSFLISTWIIRHFGPTEYGKYGYALSVVNTIGIVVGLGISKPMMREIIIESKSSKKITESASLIYLITGILGYLVTICLAYSNTNKDISVLLSVAGLGLLLKVTDLYMNLCQLDMTVQYFIKAKLIGVFTSTALKIVLICQNMPIATIALADTISLVIIVIMMEYRHNIIKKTLNIRKESMEIIEPTKRLIRKGLPLLIAGTIVPLNMRIDTILINQLMNVEEVGIYVAAIKIPLLITPLISTVDQAILPININKFKNKENVTTILNKSNSIIIYGSLGISIFLSTCSKTIINTVYGMNYSESANILAIIVFIILIGSTVRLHTQYCILTNKNKSIFIRQTIVLVLNYCLSIILIPIYGLIGAALGTLIATSFGILSYTLIDKAFRKILVITICKPNFAYSKLILKRIREVSN